MTEGLRHGLHPWIYNNNVINIIIYHLHTSIEKKRSIPSMVGISELLYLEIAASLWNYLVR